MKKIIYVILLLFLTTSCNNNVNSNTVSDNLDNNETTSEEVIEPVEPTYIDENPVIVGLYQNGKLVKDINTILKDDQDIGSFDVYFTNEENVGTTNTKTNFNKYANNYQDSSKYKIGFYISFEMTDGKKEATILGPKDMYAVSPIFNYLYDDIHQNDGSWYSHVEENQVNDNTIYSSIKLYVAGGSNKIVSPITLTVFTYDDMDDFDDLGKYRGNSKYTIKIN